MTETQLLDRMIAEYEANKHKYKNMLDYYKGKHDILNTYDYLSERANRIVIQNFITKFINEEVAYSLGNTVSYVSLSGNDKAIQAIYDNTFHWKENHNQELMRTLQIYGTAYALHYIDGKGRFSERILNPENAIVYCNGDGVPIRFIHFYKNKYDDNKYHEVYYPDGRIVVYCNDNKVDERKQPFNGIPVSVCSLENIEDTIYFKIKSLQDGYNKILSDQINIISDYRKAFLVVSGVEVDDEMSEEIEKNRVINLPEGNNSYVKYLTLDIPDTYVEHQLGRLRNAMYEVTNHIDSNEKLQSNTSGTALRNRLVFLEQRCNMMLSIVINTIYERVERLFEYLALQGTKYIFKDIKVVCTPSIPQDEISIIQGLVQLGIGENISKETALSRLPFIENPLQEIAKIENERKNNEKIELDKISDDDLGGDIDG